MLRFAFGIGNKTDVLYFGLRQIPATLAASSSFASSSSVSNAPRLLGAQPAQLEEGFGKCEEKRAQMCAETKMGEVG